MVVSREGKLITGLVSHAVLLVYSRQNDHSSEHAKHTLLLGAEKVSYPNPFGCLSFANVSFTFTENTMLFPMATYAVILVI